MGREAPSFRRAPALQRSDYVALPLDWCSQEVRAHVAPDISSGHAVMDHLAVVVKIVWLCHQQVAAKRTRVDAAALLEPANEHRIPRIFAEAPHPGWSVNVSDHAAGLVDYLFVQLAEWLKGGFALPSFLRMLMRCIGCWRCVTDSEACAWLVCAVLLQHGARRDTALKTCLGVWT